MVSGGFDPIHSGHIDYLKAASKFGDILIVCLNSDSWLISKKGKYFMGFQERRSILQNIKFVDKVISFNDDDGSCIDGLKRIQKEYPDHNIIFCNGGDRVSSNIPEKNANLPLNFEFNVGGGKSNSSSSILDSWVARKEERVWGDFYTYLYSNELKLKRLTINPNSGISLQKHFKRNELWFISKGKCNVKLSSKSPEITDEVILNTNESIVITRDTWHQVFNPYSEPCTIIEIQYGEDVNENDILRHSYYQN